MIAHRRIETRAESSLQQLLRARHLMRLRVLDVLLQRVLELLRLPISWPETDSKLTLKRESLYSPMALPALFLGRIVLPLSAACPLGAVAIPWVQSRGVFGMRCSSAASGMADRISAASGMGDLAAVAATLSPSLFSD